MSEHRDKYYYRAKKERFNSRAAYKLLEISRKFGIPREGDHDLEIGSSPGGWTQVITEISGQEVFCVDKNSMKKVPGAIFLRGDITRPEFLDELRETMSSRGVQSFDGIDGTWPRSRRTRPRSLSRGRLKWGWNSWGRPRVGDQASGSLR